jgi:hypothetical protein
MASSGIVMNETTGILLPVVFYPPLLMLIRSPSMTAEHCKNMAAADLQSFTLKFFPMRLQIISNGIQLYYSAMPRRIKLERI